MILDHLLVFSDAQPLVNSAPSQEMIHWRDVRDMGMGETLHIGFTVAEAPLALHEDAPITLRFLVQASDDEAFMSQVTTLEATDYLPLDTLPAGKTLFLRHQRGAVNRFLRVFYEVNGGALRAGKFSAYMVKDVQDAPVYYPSGWTVR